jgi:cytochrome bd-type quinol oxidase subunit 1
MQLDPEFLSRLQFAWVVGWHILLPAFTVGLASYIAFLEGVYALTKRLSSSISRNSGSGFSRFPSAWGS